MVSAGKESSVSSLKARMAALKKGMGMGSSDVKGTKLAAAAAATDAAAIQHRLAVIIQVVLDTLIVIASAAVSAKSCDNTFCARLLATRLTETTAWLAPLPS